MKLIQLIEKTASLKEASNLATQLVPHDFKIFYAYDGVKHDVIIKDVVSKQLAKQKFMGRLKNPEKASILSIEQVIDEEMSTYATSTSGIGQSSSNSNTTMPGPSTQQNPPNTGNTTFLVKYSMGNQQLQTIVMATDESSARNVFLKTQTGNGITINSVTKVGGVNEDLNNNIDPNIFLEVYFEKVFKETGNLEKAYQLTAKATGADYDTISELTGRENPFSSEKNDPSSWDKVKLKPEYAGKEAGEIFTLKSWDGRKGWIADDQGRGWYVGAHQIEPVDDIESDDEENNDDEQLKQALKNDWKFEIKDADGDTNLAIRSLAHMYNTSEQRVRNLINELSKENKLFEAHGEKKKQYFRKCQTCDGHGELNHKDDSEYNKVMSAFGDEEMCLDCYGRGEVEYDPDEEENIEEADNYDGCYFEQNESLEEDLLNKGTSNKKYYLFDVDIQNGNEVEHGKIKDVAMSNSEAIKRLAEKAQKLGVVYHIREIRVIKDNKPFAKYTPKKIFGKIDPMPGIKAGGYEQIKEGKIDPNLSQEELIIKRDKEIEDKLAKIPTVGFYAEKRKMKKGPERHYQSNAEIKCAARRNKIRDDIRSKYAPLIAAKDNAISEDKKQRNIPSYILSPEDTDPSDYHLFKKMHDKTVKGLISKEEKIAWDKKMAAKPKIKEDKNYNAVSRGYIDDGIKVIAQIDNGLDRYDALEKYADKHGIDFNDLYQAIVADTGVEYFGSDSTSQGGGVEHTMNEYKKFFTKTLSESAEIKGCPENYEKICKMYYEQGKQPRFWYITNRHGVKTNIAKDEAWKLIELAIKHEDADVYMNKFDTIQHLARAGFALHDGRTIYASW